MDKNFPPKQPTQSQQLGNWIDEFKQSAPQPNVQYPSPATSVSDQVAAMPNADKLTKTEKWIYEKLPGFSQGTVGKALEWFSQTVPGKALAKLDVLAEGLERLVGLGAQMQQNVVQGDDPFFDMNLKNAWAAGTLTYDVAQMPVFTKDADGNIVGISIDTDMPGAYALTEARKMLDEGKTIDEVRETLYNNMGALALRGQLHDTLGHIVLDPLNWALGAVKPVERLQAIRHLAVTGKINVDALQSLEQAARASGNLEDAAKFAEAIAKANREGKALSRLDKFAIAATGGIPYLKKGASGAYDILDVSKMTAGEKLLSKLNPFALTPQARASELLDMVAANIGEHLVRPMWNADPEEFVKAVSGAARGAIGDEWGHLALTIQGRAVQGVLSNSDAAVKTIAKEWAVFAPERDLLQKIASVIPGTDERKLWQMAKNNPDNLMKKIVQAASLPGGELVAKEIQAGNLTQDVLARIGKMTNDIPLLREEFYAKALVGVQDIAMKQSIIQFGIKEKGLLTKWSDALKAWESLPFIKANPANAVRNVVNNEMTLIGRGLFGFMTPAGIDAFWKGKHLPEQFHRAFGFGLTEVEREMGAFNPGDATKALQDVLEGSGKDLATKVKEGAGKVKLGIFDFSKVSSRAEIQASMQASTVGWLEFHQKYWNPKTGFTSITKHLDGDTLEKLEEIVPGITKTLDNVASSSGADSAKFEQLMQSSLEHNVAGIVQNTADKLGYKIEDVMGTEVLHSIQEGLPAAMEKGQVREFMNGIRTQMEKHVDDMFAQHIENLPGIVAAQVQAGGNAQYHRIFGKALEELWGGNVEHAIRMSSINEVLDAAKATGNYEKVGQLWEKIAQDSESHFGRVWKKFESYQEGLRKGSELAGIKYPTEVANSFKDMQKGWGDFFEFRNKSYKELFSAGHDKNTFIRELDKLHAELDTKYAKIYQMEDAAFQRVDDLMASSLADGVHQQMYMNFRDKAAQLRLADREKTAQFFKEIRGVAPEEAPNMWQKYWQDRHARLEQMRQLEARGSAALQGDVESIQMFIGQNKQTGEIKNVFDLANQYGIPSATGKGARNDKRILNTINKYIPEGTEKFKKLEDVPMEIAQQAFQGRLTAKTDEVVQAGKAFLPDAEKMFPDPMPIETGLSELNYGRSYAVLDTMAEEAAQQGTRKSALLKDLPEDLQSKVGQWTKQVNDEMSSFRAAGVQYASFRRDSALLNYSRRTNFDNMIGHLAPFAFWTTHSIANWAIYSLDRPAMVTSYLRARKFFETAGLPDQNVPTRLKGNIRVNLPFTPEWMGDTFVNPMRFLLPFDGFLQPWEQAQSGKLTTAKKTETTLQQMLEQGEISEDQYQQAIETKSGDAWDNATAKVQEGGDNYDAMDFVSMTMTPHAPLMWAYNAARGQKEDIGAFTPMTRTVKNLATMMGVKDWSNSPYNIEGKIRKEMGLPAFDKWDDYRISREISNMAADGKYDIESVKQAMQTAALVEAGKLDSKEAFKNDKVYAEAVTRANKEAAGGWAGTILSVLGIPVRAYPTGEQAQRELADQFSEAYQQYDNGDPKALTDFFDKHPEYESRLALFKKPEERLKNFMIDNVWSRWNELPKVNQDEIKEQLGNNFADFFINKETRNYEGVSPTQLQVWLKLMKGKPVGTLSADAEVMIELNQLKLTSPETAWRVETFYDMRSTQFPNWYKLQNQYYSQPENKRVATPELKAYWDARRKWMQQNPDLARYLTDDPKQLKKYENAKRNPQVAVPTLQELTSQMSPEMTQLLGQWYQGQTLPRSVEQYIDLLASQYNIPRRDLLGILSGK